MDVADIFAAIEQSAFGAAAREATWLYPLANTAHIWALMTFAAVVAIMDLRILGAFAAVPPAPLMRGARLAAMLAFLALCLSGAVLFAGEAVKMGAHTLFRVKAVLIAGSLANALLFEALWAKRVAALGAGAPMPNGARIMAALSLALWLSVAAAGRLIAYF